MRDIVAVCAILGGILELIAAIGGPQLAGVGLVSDEPAPAMAAGPFLVGVSGALLSIAGGALVSAGRSSRPWGLVLVAASVAGVLVVGPSTGWYTIGAVPALLAGVVALLIRQRPRPAE